MKDVKEQKQNDKRGGNEMGAIVNVEGNEAGTGDKNSKEQRQSMADIIL